jgi:glycyl-tRNA synthetase beta chain
MKHDFLLEVLLEEMPAPEIPGLVREFAAKFEQMLADQRLEAESVEGFSTSRRFGVLVKGLEAEQKAVETEVTGPPWKVAFADGQPTPALLGFLKREGLEGFPVEQVYRVENERGEYAALKKQVPARSAASILTEALPALLQGVRARKPMLWGDGTGPYIRPLHGLVARLDGADLPVTFLGTAAGAATRSHRHHGNAPIPVGAPADYPALLQGHHVLVLPGTRRLKVLEEAATLAASAGGTFDPHDPLLEEWVHLTEHPVVVMGRFADRFLQLPEEILISALRGHQKAVPLRDAAGRLLPRFLAVIDKPPCDTRGIVHGIEWVVEARLTDASFFVAHDRAVKLSERVPNLQHLAYHPRLGNFLQKTGRIMELAEYLAYQLGLKESIPELLRAAKLMKADLASATVAEFPALQGKIGGILAADEGLSREACDAIYDQYLPEGADGPYPRNPMGIVLALADKMEAIASLFAIEELPTGSSDPYGLRRQGNGMMEILIEKRLDLDLDLAATKALQLLSGILPVDLEKTLEALRQFFRERLAFVLQRRGVPEDTARAVLEVRACNPFDAFLRAEAIERYRQEGEFIEFALAFKRIRNMIKDAPAHDVDVALFSEAEEHALYEAFVGAKGAFLGAFQERDYAGALRAMTTLAAPLEKLFGNVLVLTENQRIRGNRLAQLQAIYREFLKVAQFSHLVVEKAQYR